MSRYGITKDIDIETLVTDFPFAVKYLQDKGIRCIACGEPIWGTLEEAASEKGFRAEEVDEIIRELNEFANKHQE